MEKKKEGLISSVGTERYDDLKIQDIPNYTYRRCVESTVYYIHMCI